MKQKKINTLKKNYNKKIETKKKVIFVLYSKSNVLMMARRYHCIFKMKIKCYKAAQRSHRPACF